MTALKTSLLLKVERHLHRYPYLNNIVSMRNHTLLREEKE